MFGGSSGQKLFADQFEPDGANFIYRRSGRGAPVPLTATEKEAFVRQFRRSLLLLSLGFPVLLILLITALVFSEEVTGVRVTEWHIVALSLTALAAMTLLWLRIWNAPAAALRGRGAIGPGRSWAAARDEMYASMSWWRIAAMVGGTSLIGLLSIPWGRWPEGAQEWLQAVCGAAMLGMAVAAPLLKVRSTRRSR